MATATQIIERCGGIKTVADWLGLERSTVQRWTYEAPRGCGDRIPTKNWEAIISTAARHGIKINPEELIPPAITAAGRRPALREAKRAAS